MQNDGTVKKIGFVAFSNIVKLISSILVAFIIPNLLGLTDYGYYKVFILYLTYVGLFHFGFIDGIYLKYGGVDYNKLNKQKFRSYFSFLSKLEFIISIVGVIATLLLIKDEKRFIFSLLFLNLLATNLTTYYQFISQITSRFKEYSLRIIILSFTNILIVGYMYLFDITDYKVYVSLIVIFNFMLLFWYVYTYREITFGSKEPIKTNKKEINSFFKNGIPLLLANLAATVVITLDKQVVEIFFPVEVFGVYSFAYSMLSMITVVVSAVGVVLYPTLKRTNISNIASNYTFLNRLIIIIVLIGIVGYFPLMWIIPSFLPNYADSLVIFRVALPGLVMTSAISAIKHNFFKITDQNIKFFFISLIAITLNLGLNLTAYFAYGTTVSIAISSIIGISLWYFMTELFMVKKHQIEWKINSLILIGGISLFYGLTEIENYILAGLLYGISILGVTFAIFHKEIMRYKTKIFR